MGNHITKQAATQVLTPPLSKLLGSQDFKEHKAMVALEFEVLAKKYDSFGWDKGRGTAAQDRLISDWMDVLGDYPLDEIKAAIREHICDCTNKKRPHEGQILAIIQNNRAKLLRSIPRQPEHEPEREEPTPEQKQRMADFVGERFPSAVRKMQ